MRTSASDRVALRGAAASRVVVARFRWLPCVLLAMSLFSSFASTSIKLGTVRQIRGPADLDLEGDFLYAINFSANDPARTVRGVVFRPDRQPIPGATLVGPQQVTPWQTRPEFGETSDANQLEEICQDIRWADSGSGERLRASLAVTAGEEYKVQVLISANGDEDRHWDIRLNGREAVDEITSLGVAPGQSYSRSRATLFTHQFVATGPTVTVEMGDLFGSNDGGDRNPIWQALTLERVTAPPTPDAITLPSDRFFPGQTEAIAFIEVTDRKTGALHQLTLVPGASDADNAWFRIQDNALFPGSHDFAVHPAGTTFSVRVRATDVADPQRLLETPLTLTLAEPRAPSAIRLDAASVNASALPGAMVARIEVTDPDTFDRHRIELVPGTGDTANDLFVIEDATLRLRAIIPVGVESLSVRLRATDLAGLTVEGVWTLAPAATRVRINEILSGRIGGIDDAGSGPAEWIELLNLEPHYVDLTGWHLTDDPELPGRWTFPARVMAPNGVLVVLATGASIPPEDSTNLHASFSLASDGEWIGLFPPNGSIVASSLEFPVQFPGVSFGYGSDERIGYLPVPTPWKTNGDVAPYGRNEVLFSRAHGFQTNIFDLSLEATVPGSVIRYTLDGSEPTTTRGTVYTGPFSISPATTGATRGTRIVRALAIHPDAAYSSIGTRTYLFIRGVAGGTTDGVVGQTRLVTSITRHATYGPLLADAFLALPALSVILPDGPTTTERRASIELLDPTEKEPGFQVDCGIEATGTTSLGSPKLSMAARFRASYGQATLRYPVFAHGSRVPAGAATEFRELRIRSHSHDTFYWLGTRENPPTPYGDPPVRRSGDAQLARNPWIDEMQLLMGQPGKHGRQVHLFLNGAYHGIYHIHEHADEDFMASYFPGGADDFHFTGGGTTGSEHDGADTWVATWSSVRESLGNFAQAKRWIDVTNLCDYMLLSFYAGNDWDWSSQHNWSAAGPKLPDRGGWKFFQQDSDITLQDVAADCTDQDVPDGIFTALMRLPDFRVLFRDRIQHHCFGDGMLTPARASALYEDRMQEISTAVIAETARWQPSSSVGALPWDRDQEWTNEWRYLRNTFFPQRTTRLLQQLRAHPGWWPLNPPSVTPPGGTMPLGSPIEFTGTGTVYYTTDGSDPRLPGGAINPSARTGNTGLNLDRALVVRARSRTGAEWSALVEFVFLPEGIVAASASNVVLSEIQYHPLDDPLAEFIEFMNTSASPVDFSGVTLTQGVAYEFPRPTILLPGARLVVVRDPSAFNTRYRTQGTAYYRDVAALGPWEGSLSNSGETIQLHASDGSLIVSCTYGTEGRWPERADGRGSTLELLDPERAPGGSVERSAWLNNPAHWRSSAEVHGTPGAFGTGPIASVVINEILAVSVAPQTDTIELLNVSGSDILLAGWYLSDSGNEYRKYRFPEGIHLGAGARLVLNEADFNNATNPACLIPFAWNNRGDSAVLVEADAMGTLLRFADEVTWGGFDPGVSIGRYPDGTGPFVWLESPTPGEVNAAAFESYDAWASQFYPSGTAIEKAPGADYDGDGIRNFAEYAFVLAPGANRRSAVQWAAGVSGEGWVFTFRTRTGASGIAYQVETSTDLRTWYPGDADVEVVSSEALGDGATVVRARLRSSGTVDSVRFLRVSATSR